MYVNPHVVPTVNPHLINLPANPVPGPLLNAHATPMPTPMSTPMTTPHANF